MHRSRSRVRRGPLQHQHQTSVSPVPSPIPQLRYRTTSLELRSRSPSPVLTPSSNEYYGTTQLELRSRSPSPTVPPKRVKSTGRRLPATPTKPSTLNLQIKHGELPLKLPTVAQSPTVPGPTKSPGSINFPKLEASPTHMPKLPIAMPNHGHMSATARTRGRDAQAKSQAVTSHRHSREHGYTDKRPNGVKPGPSRNERGGLRSPRRSPQPNSDSDDDSEWC